MHSNISGPCSGCDFILNKYPNFSTELRTWFEALRIEHPELHTSCAGRGKIEQAIVFHSGNSNAEYGQSAHNYNAALDVFFQINGEYRLDDALFQKIIVPSLYPALQWYGAATAVYYERPHIELSNWISLKDSGVLKLVE